MENRRLSVVQKQFVNEHLAWYAVFNSNGRRVTRLITEDEANKALKLIESGDESRIDEFCYRIA